MKKSLGSLVSGLILSAVLMAAPSMPAQNSSGSSQAADNTKTNKTDRNSNAQTADQAKNNMSDRDLMKHVRQDIVKDKSLSTYGHNVKIVAVNGKVTLRGAVHTEDEKKAIEEHATKYAGSGNVTNELSVKGS